MAISYLKVIAAVNHSQMKDAPNNWSKIEDFMAISLFRVMVTITHQTIGMIMTTNNKPYYHKLLSQTP